MESFRKSFKIGHNDNGEDGSSRNGGEEYMVEDLRERMHSSRASRLNLIENELELDSTQRRFISRRRVINGLKDLSLYWFIHPDNR